MKLSFLLVLSIQIKPTIFQLECLILKLDTPKEENLIRQYGINTFIELQFVFIPTFLKYSKVYILIVDDLRSGYILIARSSVDSVVSRTIIYTTQSPSLVYLKSNLVLYFIYPLLCYYYSLISLLVDLKTVRVFANGPGDLSSILGSVIPKTLKMVLDTSLLNTQRYKVRIKG